MERFHSIYCGLCHTLGRRYGFPARFLLNYDFTLLAILLSLPRHPLEEKRRCMAHPCRGCAVVKETDALSAAADRSIILFWWQLQDHIADHRFFPSLPYRAAALLFCRAYRRACEAAPAFDAAVRDSLRSLDARERASCASLDDAAEPFARRRRMDRAAVSCHSSSIIWEDGSI